MVTSVVTRGLERRAEGTRNRSSLEAQEWAEEGSAVRWKYVKESWGTSETENPVLKLAHSSRNEGGGGVKGPVVSSRSSMKLKSPHMKVSMEESALSIEVRSSS